MPGTFSPPWRVSDPYMHHGTCVTHVPWCMPASLTSDCLWSQWRGKRSRHSRRIRNPQFYVSGKGPTVVLSHYIYENMHGVVDLVNTLQAKVRPWPDQVVGLSSIHQRRENSTIYGSDESAQYPTKCAMQHYRECQLYVARTRNICMHFRTYTTRHYFPVVTN